VVAALLNALKDEDALVRSAAGGALQAIRPYWTEIIPELTRRLKDPSLHVRWQAAKLLAEFGASARAAVPALTMALQDPDRDVRRAAAETLGVFGSDAKSAVPALVKYSHEDSFTAGFALWRIDRRPETVMPALIRALRDPNPMIRASAAGMLGQLGPAAKDAFPALTELLKDNEALPNDQAKRALIAIDKKAAAKLGVW
jgi:HEAT repeat protein